MKARSQKIDNLQCLESPVRTEEQKGDVIQYGISRKKYELNCKYGYSFQMAPGMHGPDAHRNLTSNYCSILEYHPIMVRQSPGPGAQFFLGESPEFK